ncbi:uncharacterized protein [Branchiostoma lanceolatum]|uniref:uncharacterized protein n=1 Tax=Branchiostoma lanceolatum TaxID=7740 RepID=UPI003451AF1C
MAVPCTPGFIKWAVLVLIATTATVTAQVCIIADYVSFNGVCYKDFAELKTYDEARQTCAADGGLLAMPKDNVTNTFIHNLGPPAARRWIGLTDADNETQWEFEDGQTLVSSGYNNWQPNEPNDGNGREDCAEVLGSGHVWNDEWCSKRKGFICQLETTTSLSVTTTMIPITTAPLLSTAPEVCPVEGYVSFNGVCYKYFAELKTYDEARQTCAAEGGLVAMPKDSETNAFIHDLGGVTRRWIGLTDAVNEGQWVFEDGQTLVSSGYDNWWPGEPKGVVHENCAEVVGPEHLWNDLSCNGFTRGFSCQLVCLKAGYVSFNGGCYKYFAELKTYDEAKQTCAADGGQLAMPKDDATNTFIHDLGGATRRWFGLTRDDNEGQWVFGNGQTLTSTGYSNWSPGISGLNLDDAGIGHLTVSWTEGSLPISRYSLRYQPADGSGSYQDLSPAPAAGDTSATVSGLLPDTIYTLTLTSFGQGDQSNGVITGTYTTDSVVVNVECDQDSMAISIPLAALLAVDVANMHLLDADCGATVDEVDGVVMLETNLQQCGTIQETLGDDKFVFSNEAIANQVTHANGAVRNQPISLPFQCEFLRQYVVSQGGNIMYNIPSPRIQIVDANNTFTLEMRMFTSTDFSASYESSDYPIQVTASDRLNFGLSVTSPLDNLELFAQDCVSTPTTDPNATPRVNIIDDGCEIDDTLEKDNDRSNDKALYYMVDAFTFPNALDPSLVYFHCTMIICFKDDPDSRCKQGCIPAGRRRRAVSDGPESRIRRASSRDHAADIMQGPFKIESEDAAAAGAPVGAVVGAVVGVVGMALLVVAVVLVKKRGGLPMGSKKRDDDTVGQDNYAFQAWGKTDKTGPADTKA